MTRKMVVFVAVLTGLCVGQMCTGPVAATDTRLRANDYLRTACSGYLLNDAEVETSLTLVEADRMDGWAKIAELDATLAVCNKPQYPSDLRGACTTCNTAIINQVYGQ